MKDSEKFVEIPFDREKFPEIPEKDNSMFIKNVNIVFSSIKEKGFDVDNIDIDEITKVIQNFSDLCAYAIQGYCKVNFDVYAQKYKNNSEVKFNDVKNIVEDSLKKVKKYEQSYNRSFS